MSPSARRTGRPRSAEADRAILGATRAALVELGWAKLTLGDVAARAGVAKTTLYRRWASKCELVVDAVAAVFDEHLEAGDHGSLHADVEAAVIRLGALLERPETGTALMAVLAEAMHDESLRCRVRSAIVDRQKRLVTIGRERARLRGELPRAEDPEASARNADLIFDAVAGTVLHRLMVSAEPVDPHWARDFTDLLLYGMTRADPGGAAAAGPAPGGAQKPAGSV
ncbi:MULTISPECIES: TetR/AcrR family transcriptional regulator [Streptomyces]|uniref:TetR/AcrR family transcriptional regulator n=1 Tax=Streptomyces lycopersici TaxID=2974589 RepID=UPI0021CE497D|nr:TetR/AcrR family transcriptional regulator [Streptomyces sp. NEAU-383]